MMKFDELVAEVEQLEVEGLVSVSVDEEEQTVSMWVEDVADPQKKVSALLHKADSVDEVWGINYYFGDVVLSVGYVSMCD